MPQLFQQGVNQAAAEIRSRLSSLYDIGQALSNSNQFLYSQSGSLQISIGAAVYVGQIYFLNSPKNWPPSNITGVVDLSSYITVGTSAGASDLLNNQQIGVEGFQWVINKYYATAGTIYVAITGPALDITVIANKPANGSSTADTAANQLVSVLVKNDLLIEILSILAIKRILASGAGVSKLMQQLIDNNDETLMQLQEKVRTLDLPEAKMPVSQVPHTIDSSFSTLG